MKIETTSNPIRNRKLTIAVANIFFGGIAIKYKSDSIISLKDWGLAHFKLLIFRSEKFIKQRHFSKDPTLKKTNVAKFLVERFEPEILILNEVMPKISRKELDYLESKKYNIVMNLTIHKRTNLNHASVIATKFKGEQVEIDWKLKGGGGVCAYKIPEIKTLVVAPHPTAFNTKVRNKQLAYLATFLKNFLDENPEYEIMIGGDFNTEGHNVDEHFKGMGLQRFSEKSFPNDELWARFSEKKIAWLKSILYLTEGQRDLDHILVSQDWKLNKIESMETGSDHKALVVEISG